MNSEINKKTPAFIYAKDFQLSKVLGNLQAYKLAVGDVKQAELDEVSNKHGNNLGAIYGNLITKASLTNKRENETQILPTKRRKNRKRRRKSKKDNDAFVELDSPSLSSEFVQLDEPLPLPECLRIKEEKSGSNSEDSARSENSDDESLDFFGLSTRNNSSSEKGSNQSCSSRLVEETRTTPKSSEKKSQFYENQHHTNSLTTYKCWKCNRRGHMSEHCTIPQTSSGFVATDRCSEKTTRSSTSARTDLKELYSSCCYKISAGHLRCEKWVEDVFTMNFLRCRRLKHSTNANCSECGNTSNLAFCFECGLTLCDGRGHLIEHLLNYPAHTKIYSHKLQRLLKCSNTSCDVVNTKQLLMCSQCLSKTFDRNYSLINATWSDRGLRAISNAIACEEHFHWHRMNCFNSFEEALFSHEKMEQLKREGNGLLSEFFF